MPLPSSIYNRIRRQARQYRATTGREISPSLMSSLLEAELSALYSRQGEERQLNLQERALNEEVALTRDKLEAERKAARITGAAQLGTTSFAGYEALKDTKTGKALGRKAGALGEKLLDTGKEGLKLAGLAETVPSTVSTALPPSATTFGGTAQGAYTGAEFSTLGTEAVATPANAGATTLTTAAGSVASAGAGYIGGKIGPKVLPFGGEVGERIESGIGGFAAGAAVGSVVPGVGTIVGGVIGGVVGATSGGKVICSELVRQGKLNPVIAYLDGVHRERYIDDDTYQGYVAWAIPVVKYMQHDIYGPIVTFLIKPFAKAWAYEMASRVDISRKGSLLGKLLKITGEPVCRLIGRWA